jgi:hypothetical protein
MQVRQQCPLLLCAVLPQAALPGTPRASSCSCHLSHGCGLISASSIRRAGALVGNLPGDGLGLLLPAVAPHGHVGEPLA